MSDVDPDLPYYLVDAILSQGPPPDAVDLVKNAFTWRTIDAELMELSYDSVLDEAGVRDATARRTMEFTLGDVSIVIEVGVGSLRGQLNSPDATSVVQLVNKDGSTRSQAGASGGFVFADVAPGSYWLEFSTADASYESAAFTVG